MVDSYRSIRDATLGHRNRWILVMMVLGWFLVIGLRIVVPTILPSVKALFDLTNLQIGTVVTVLWITYAMMQFPSGALSDRFGERAVLLLATLLIICSILSYSFSITFGLFLLATGILGLGTGLFGTPRTTMLTHSFPNSKGTALGITFAAGSIGAASLPAIFAVLVTKYGIRQSFLLSLPFLLILVVGIYWHTPKFASADGSILELSWHSVTKILGGVSRRPVAIATIGFAVMLFAYQGFIAFFSTYLVEMKTLSTPTASLYYSAFFLIGALVQPTGGYLSDRFDDSHVMAGSALISAIALAMLPFVRGLAVLLVVSCLIGFQRGVGPIATKLMVANLPDDIEGSGLGMLRTGIFGVSSFGSILVGFLADAGYFDGAIFALALITAVGGGVLFLLSD